MIAKGPAPADTGAPRANWVGRVDEELLTACRNVYRFRSDYSHGDMISADPRACAREEFESTLGRRPRSNMQVEEAKEEAARASKLAWLAGMDSNSV